MKKIRVLFVIHSLGGGGAERVMSYLLNNLDKRKFDITLITFSEEKKYEIPNYINYFIIKKLNNKFLKILYIFYKLIKIFYKNEYDLIVSFLTHVNLIVIFSWFLAGKKSILLISERSNSKQGQKLYKFSFLRNSLIRILYPMAYKIIAVSNGIKNILIKYYNIPSSRINVIYNPIDLKKIDKLKKEKITTFFQKNTPTILSCGRLTFQKNFPLLIKAHNKIIKKGINAQLVILGEGEEKENLKNLVKKLKLEDQVFFLGFQDNPYKYMSRATIFVLSSRWEGFPNVLLEAMACGVPVISTDCPSGPGEIIEDGKNGFLVPNENEEKLAEAMEKLLLNEDLRKKFSIEGRKFIEKKFKLEKIIKEWENLFINNLNKKNNS